MCRFFESETHLEENWGRVIPRLVLAQVFPIGVILYAFRWRTGMVARGFYSLYWESIFFPLLGAVVLRTLLSRLLLMGDCVFIHHFFLRTITTAAEISENLWVIKGV